MSASAFARTDLCIVVASAKKIVPVRIAVQSSLAKVRVVCHRAEVVISGGKHEIMQIF